MKSEEYMVVDEVYVIKSFTQRELKERRAEDVHL